MKKRFTLFAMACLSLGTGLQAQNLFDAKDVDANGWLWFDTAEKIEKYVGDANNGEGKTDPNGKLIQMVCADFGNYEDCTAGADIVGAGTDGKIGGPEAKTGGIRIPRAQAAMGTDGAGFVVRMPSCTSFNVYLSSEAKMYVRLQGSVDESGPLKDYSIISARYASVLGSLSKAGQKEWTGIEKLSNGSEPAFTLTSTQPIVCFYQNFATSPVYLHGIKVLTAETTAIENVAADNQLGMVMLESTLSLRSKATVSVFAANGTQVYGAEGDMIDLSHLAKGVYVVKGQTELAQQIIKICIR